VLDAQAAGAELIVVDPRRTPTAERADLHVATLPGSDWALLLGVVKVVLDRGWDNRDAGAELRNVDGLSAPAGEADLDDLGRRCDVGVDVIEDIARRFSGAATAMCIARTGTSQTIGGTAAE
jgi:formate dehydrogenase